MFDESEMVGKKAAVDQGNNIYALEEAEVAKWQSELKFVTEEWAEDMKSDGYDADHLLKLANSLIEKYEQEVSK